MTLLITLWRKRAKKEKKTKQKKQKKKDANNFFG